MPQIEQPLQLIILSINVNKYKKIGCFSFVFKVMEYPQTRTQKFNLNQEKKRFSLPPPSRLEGVATTPPPLISGMTPWMKTFITVL